MASEYNINPGTIAGNIASEAVDTIKIVANRPTNDLSKPAVDHATGELKAAIAKSIDPMVQHVTNTEPWYQSRVTLGSIIAVAAGAATIFGINFPAEMQGQVIEWILALAPLLGGLFALWGRWVSVKPLGTS